MGDQFEFVWRALDTLGMSAVGTYFWGSYGARPKRHVWRRARTMVRRQRHTSCRYNTNKQNATINSNHWFVLVCTNHYWLCHPTYGNIYLKDHHQTDTTINYHATTWNRAQRTSNHAEVYCRSSFIGSALIIRDFAVNGGQTGPK